MDILAFKVSFPYEKWLNVIASLGIEQFDWKTARDDVLKKLNTPADPVESPTMAGIRDSCFMSLTYLGFVLTNQLVFENFRGTFCYL